MFVIFEIELNSGGEMIAHTCIHTRVVLVTLTITKTKTPLARHFDF